MEKVLGIYGAGGLGREVLELARLINLTHRRWKDIVFIVDAPREFSVDGSVVHGYDVAKERFAEGLEVVLGVGEPSVRERLFDKVRRDAIPTPTLVHPQVHIPDSASLGRGVVVQFGCFVSVGVEVKDNVLLQPMCAIGHDCVLGEGCVISSFDSIAGGAKVGYGSYIGMGASVMEKVSIGDYCIIGMGSVVFKDIPDEMIAMGNPARPLRKNEERHVFKH